MAKVLCLVQRGQKGYVPLRSNSHGWVDLANIPNDTEIWKLTDTEEENGHSRVEYYEGAAWPKSPTGEYWMLTEKLDVVPVDPEDDGGECYEVVEEVTNRDGHFLWLKKIEE